MDNDLRYYNIWSDGHIKHNMKKSDIIIGGKNSHYDISWLNYLYNLGSYIIELKEMTSSYRCKDDGDKYVMNRIFCGYWILSTISELSIRI